MSDLEIVLVRCICLIYIGINKFDLKVLVIYF